MRLALSLWKLGSFRIRSACTLLTPCSTSSSAIAICKNSFFLPTRYAIRLVKSDLVVTGELRVGAGTRIVGCVKSHGDLYLAEGVAVDGSVVAGRDLSVGRGCDIRGPVVAERDGRIEAGTQVGSAKRPTTLSVRCLEVEAGSVVHGTVWAHGGGLVLPRPGTADPVAGPAKGPN